MTTNQVQALKQALAVLRGLTFKDRPITDALASIHRALEEEATPTLDRAAMQRKALTPNVGIEPPYSVGSNDRLGPLFPKREEDYDCDEL